MESEREFLSGLLEQIHVNNLAVQPKDRIDEALAREQDEALANIYAEIQARLDELPEDLPEDLHNGR